MNATTPEGLRAAPELDPEIRRFLETMAADASRYPPPEELPFDEARRVLERVRARWTEGGPRMYATAEHRVKGGAVPFDIRLYLPGPERDKPALIYLHGGGWTYFSPDTHDRLMREYAARADAVVVGVDYALSPENKYPVALNQVLHTVAWLGKAGPSVGVDPRRLALGGDSAGANLAVAAALQLRDRGELEPVKDLVLNYGAFDAACSEESERRFGGDGYMLGAAEMRRFWDNYVRDSADLDDPLVCPLRADLAGLPPAFFVIPECDLLTEQNRQMAGRMTSAGVRVEAVEYPGTTHSFLEAMSIAAVSRRALADTADWLRRNL